MGCKPVPTWRGWDLLGMSITITMTKAMNENRLSEEFFNIIKEVEDREWRKCLTFHVRFPPGVAHFFTFDPRNLQAILATQFKDFQIPSSRLAAFSQLLGQGIVSDSCSNL